MVEVKEKGMRSQILEGEVANGMVRRRTFK